MIVLLIICGLLFVVGEVVALGYEVPVVWSVGAVIGAAIGLAGLIAFGVWQIILSRRAMKASDEAMKASIEYIRALGEETVKGIEKNGEETIKRIQANGDETIGRIKRHGKETLRAIQGSK